MKTEKKKYQLPKEFATKWVAALRSGKYKQGSGRLKSETGYCCLGVACAIYGAKVKDLSDYEWIGEDIKTNFYHDSHIIEKIPSLLHGHPATNKFVGIVSSLNDSGKPFPEIADWIESNVEFI